MKKCSYCGKEYPDNVLHCLIDEQPLLGEESKAVPREEPIVAHATLQSIDTSNNKSIISQWNDRQMRVLELTLVCAVAFGGSILVSGYVLIFGNSSVSGWGSSGALQWLHSLFNESISLVLLFYVLSRRGKSLSSLGLPREWKDIARSIALLFGGWLAVYAVYAVLYLSGLVALDHNASNMRVADTLFGGGVFPVTFLFLFLNPFFEELIVRAYLMTEIRQLTNSASKAIILSTVLQTSYHLYQGVPLALSNGALFLVFSIYYTKTNRIVPIILAHLYCDVGSTLWFLLQQS